MNPTHPKLMSIPPSSRYPSKSHSPSELFTVRVWCEALNDHFEWRGKVSHGSSHQECYFREWGRLIEFIREALPVDVSNPTGAADENKGAPDESQGNRE
jgi:hypothetical protein